MELTMTSLAPSIAPPMPPKPHAAAAPVLTIEPRLTCALPKGPDISSRPRRMISNTAGILLLPRAFPDLLHDLVLHLKHLGFFRQLVFGHVHQRPRRHVVRLGPPPDRPERVPYPAAVSPFCGPSP